MVALNFELPQVPVHFPVSKQNLFRVLEHFVRNNNVDSRCSSRTNRTTIDQFTTRVIDQVVNRKGYKWSNLETPRFQEMTHLQTID